MLVFFLKITLSFIFSMVVDVHQAVTFVKGSIFYFLAAAFLPPLAFSARRRSRRSFLRTRGVPSALVRFFSVLKAMVSSLLRWRLA